MIASVLPTYNRAPLSFVKGEGSWLIEADGRRFLDLGAGIAVNALGHAHPALVAALTEQAGSLWHTSNLYHIPQQEALADKLGVSVNLSAVAEKAPTVAFVHENLCVGCTKCFKRCPTDAILGGPKQIHAVFADACTGCEKCYDVCPTECIEMRLVKPTLQTWYWPEPVIAG